ncbi:hypothetical protein C8Q74DRAFT_1295192 [Fomes fomentarius]|nr:hypothetical protein C8Q74DRAFT_1295192 [Fomes fomentarius]
MLFIGHLRPLIGLCARYVGLGPLVATLLVSPHVHRYFDSGPHQRRLSRNFEEREEEHGKRISVSRVSAI